uniref:DUF4347 domain-containing protein n=1 Tax=Chlorobium chlorochromatii (strain CaD3) TaxID=340177 RepID=Q3APA7_CHLCH
MNTDMLVSSNAQSLLATAKSCCENIACSLVIADAHVDDVTLLTTSLTPFTDIVLVTHEADALATLQAAFAAGYEHIHFLGHGEQGGITLGGKLWQTNDFVALAAEVDSARETSLHFWSCYTGAGDKGLAFVSQLSEVFGDAVTAFSGLVGAASKGGSWVPDVIVGSVHVPEVPFINALTYAHTLDVTSNVYLTSVGRDEEGDGDIDGVDVQLWLKAGTTINAVDFTLAYPSVATVNGIITHPAFSSWTWNINNHSNEGVIIAGLAGDITNSSVYNSFTAPSDMWIGRVSFDYAPTPTVAPSFVVSLTDVFLNDVELVTTSAEWPILSTDLSTVPVWNTDLMLPPSAPYEYAPGETVSLSFPISATDPDSGDVVSYSAVIGQVVDNVFQPLSGFSPIPLMLSNDVIGGSFTVPSIAPVGSYVVRLLADDHAGDAYLGTAFDVPFSIVMGGGDLTFNTSGTIDGSPVAGEGYYKFAPGTISGELAIAGDTGFQFVITTDYDENPMTFNASWEWLNESDGADYGTVTFFDISSGIAGPETWSATFEDNTIGMVIADSSTDADTLPDGIIVRDDMDNQVAVPLAWQQRDANGAIATFSATVKNEDNEDISFSGSLIDSDENGEPDRVVGNWGDEQFNDSFLFADVYGDSQPDEWMVTSTKIRAGRVQNDANGNPAGLYITWDNQRPVWNVPVQLPPLMFTQGQNINFSDYALADLYATDPNGDAITYSAVVGYISPVGFVPVQEFSELPVWMEEAGLQGSFTIPTNAPTGSYVLRLLADDHAGDTYAGTALDVLFTIEGVEPVGNILLNTTQEVEGNPGTLESYYKFRTGSTGIAAVFGDSGFQVNLFEVASDANPYTFNAAWTWFDNGTYSDTNEGVLTFIDTNSNLTDGLEQWQAAINDRTIGEVIADGNDADTLPDGIVVEDDMDNLVDVDLNWQTRDEVTGAIATFSTTVKNKDNEDIAFSGSLIDINNDGVADRVVGNWGNDQFNDAFTFADINMDEQPDEWVATQTKMYSGRVQNDASGTPAGVYMEKEPEPIPDPPYITQAELTYDIGITGASLAETGAIVVKIASPYMGMSNITIPVTELTLQGSLLTIPLTSFISTYPQMGAALLVQIPAGVVVGQNELVNAWQIGEPYSGYYALSSMPVLPNDNSSDGADWVLGTSNNDSIAAGAGDDVLDWSVGNDTIDAGDGYDHQYLPIPGMYPHLMPQLDESGVLHLVKYNYEDSLTGGSTTDVYRITRLAPSEYRIDSMDSIGVTVVQTLHLSNAEVLSAGYHPTYLAVQYNTESHYVSGTAWDDVISVDLQSFIASPFTSVWGDSGDDMFVLNLPAIYSALELVPEGENMYLLQGIGSGPLATTTTLGQLQVTSTGYVTLTVGSGDTALSVSLSNIEKYQFVAGSVVEELDVAASHENHLPVGTVTISGDPTEGWMLNALLDFTDEDGMSNSIITYQWYANGVAISGATDSSYELTQTELGKQLSVTVSYVDDYGGHESVNSLATTAIQNSNDEPEGKPTITGTAAQGKTLTVDVSGITDEDGLENATFSYQWYAGGMPIDDTTASTFTLQETQVWHQISVAVSYTDDFGQEETVYSDYTDIVENVNDKPTGTVTIIGTVAQNEWLSVDPSAINDPDGLDGLFEYQWKADGAIIEGANESQFLLTADYAAKALSVTVSYYDEHGTYEQVTSTATTPFSRVNNLPDGYVFIVGNQQENETLTVGYYLYDADYANGEVNPNDISYQWQVWSDSAGTNGDWVDLQGATSSTLLLDESLSDKWVWLTLSYTDPHNTTESLSSYYSVFIYNLNDEPTGEITIYGTIKEGETLTVNTSTLADADGLGELYYQWYANGEEIGGANYSTYDLTQFDVGKRISVAAGYWDGHGTWESVASELTATVARDTTTNNEPTGWVTISGTATQNRMLLANFNIVDSDGLSDAVYSYQWKASSDGINWDDIFGATQRSYKLTQADVDKHITVEISYTDDANHLNTISSDPTRAVWNVNDAPTGKPTLSGTLTEDQTLTIVTSAITDADGIAQDTMSYQWQADGVTFAWTTENTYILTQDEVGKAISVIVSYYDNGGTYESVTSSPTVAVANVNDQPQGEVLVIGSAVVDETLWVSTGMLTDEDGPDLLYLNGNMSYQWQSSTDDGVNWNDIIGATESGYDVTLDESGEKIRVQVTYTDNGGKTEVVYSSATDAVVSNAIDPNGTIAITGTFKQGETLNATVTDADGMGTVSYQWQSSTNGTTWDPISGATSASFILTEAQVVKQIRVIASYTDGGGTIESPSATTTTIENLNDNPIGSVTITGTAKQGEALTAKNTLADADGMGTVSYQWQSSSDGTNWSAINGATASTYKLTAAEVGKQISVVANYTDGHNTPESKASVATVAVANTNDAPTGTVKITGSGQQGAILAADTSTLADADGLPTTLAYQWYAGGVIITGATNGTYQLTKNEVGKAITVKVSYTDGGGTPESVTSLATSAISNVNDAPTGGVTIDGLAKQGQRLTVDTSTLFDDDGIPTNKLGYQWQAGGLNIANATESSYKLTQAEVGKAITVKVTYTDLQGTTEAVTSDATASVANVNDTPTGTITISKIDDDGNKVDLTAAPQQNDILVASNTLVDGDGPPALAVTYQWQANGADINGAVGRYFEVTQAEVGKTMGVVASYTDAFKNPESVSSTATAAVVNVNDAPTGSVTISGNPTQGQELTAITSTLADADGFKSTLSYQWQSSSNNIDWSNITGATNRTYTLTNSEADKVIRVVVSYTDKGNTDESVNSKATRSVTNDNDAPTGTVTITGTIKEGQTLTASNSIVDPDGIPAGTITYQWKANDENIYGATYATYTLTQEEVGKHISVVASYTDNGGTSESVSSTSTTKAENVDNDPIGTITITGTAKEKSTLTFVNTLQDADGMGIVAYQWQSSTDNGSTWSNIAGANASSLTLTELQVGQRISVVATYTDGYGNPETVRSSNATSKVKNENNNPEGKLTIVGNAKAGKTLYADHTLTDEDGMGAILYKWQSSTDNGSIWNDIDDATDSFYTLTKDDVGNNIRVVATYTDGHGTVENVFSEKTATVKKVISGSSHDGYLVNALVWVDEDSDNTLDWTDTNRNSKWDEGEGESWTLTDNTGQFTGLEGDGTKPLRITANPNGGTIDISTGNEFDGSFFAPADATVISALTTLIAAAMDSTTNAAAAETKVETALGLDAATLGATLSLTSYDPLAEASKTSTTDAAKINAVKVHAATIQLNNIMDVAISVADAAGSTLSKAQIVENVSDSLLAQAGTDTVDVTSDAVIEVAIKTGLSTGLTTKPNFNDVVAAIADALALANREIATIATNATGTNAVASITDIVEAQIVAQSTIVPDAYAAVVADDSSAITTKADTFSSQLGEAAKEVETIFVNHAPTGSVVINGVVMPGEILTAATDSIADNQGVGAISYQWLRGGEVISGATNATYQLVAADIGKAISVKASYTDGAGFSESMNSNATIAVPDAPTSLSDVTVDVANTLTNDATPTVEVDLTNKALEVGDVIQIIDSNHGNAVLYTETITTTGITLKEIQLAVALIDDAHALQVRLVDSAGNEGLASNGVTTITVDTTISHLSGAVYNASSGTVTALLDMVLDSGDKLYGSVNNGNWEDITAKVNGTSINWDGVGSNATKIDLKVQDEAGNTDTEAVTIPVSTGHNLTIHTAYWKDSKAISGVTLENGAQTDSVGAHLYTAVTDATKTISPELAVATADKAAIGLLDAVGILKSLVGLTTLNKYQEIAADYDGSGKVGLLDAVGVLKYLVGLPGAAPEWVFAESTASEPSAIDDMTVSLNDDKTVELIGILRGDVDGSWVNLH